MALFTSACSVLGVEKPDSKENALEAIKALSTLKGCIIFAARICCAQFFGGFCVCGKCSGIEDNNLFWKRNVKRRSNDDKIHCYRVRLAC